MAVVRRVASSSESTMSPLCSPPTTTQKLLSTSPDFVLMGNVMRLKNSLPPGLIVGRLWSAINLDSDASIGLSRYTDGGVAVGGRFRAVVAGYRRPPRARPAPSEEVSLTGVVGRFNDTPSLCTSPSPLSLLVILFLSLPWASSLVRSTSMMDRSESSYVKSMHS